MRKELQRYGNNLVLVFTKAEEKIYKLTRGDLLDVDMETLIKGWKAKQEKKKK